MGKRFQKSLALILVCALMVMGVPMMAFGEGETDV